MVEDLTLDEYSTRVTDYRVTTNGREFHIQGLCQPTWLFRLLGCKPKWRTLMYGGHDGNSFRSGSFPCHHDSLKLANDYIEHIKDIKQIRQVKFTPVVKD